MPSALSETLYFDARYIRIGHHDGISRFTVGLITALHRRVDLVVLVHDQRQLEKLPVGIKYELMTDPTSIREFLIPKNLNKLGAKLVYSPMQTMGTLGRRYKVVLTLHDLIYYRHPKPPPSLPWFIRVGWRLFHLSYFPQRLVLNGADAIVTVSETTKALIGKTRLTRKPVHVVYNAAGNLAGDYQHAMPKHRPQRPFQLVYMGSFMDYKNVELLISAMRDLNGYQLHLLSPITADRKRELQRFFSSDQIIFHDGVSESVYHQILDSAYALVSASKDEGFGIPLVEAMARGIPVVVSDIDIFREIGAGAAIYFDASDASDFVTKVRSLESDQEWLQRSRLSYQQANNFGWDKSASALIRALRSVIEPEG